MTAANCTLTAASATITTANTSGLRVGNSVQGTPVSVTSCTTSNVTNPTVVLTANTSSLLVGMFVSATGIPANSRITAISAGVSFTMSSSATAAGTITVTANYLSSTTTITAISPGVSFTVSTAPQLSASGITLFAPNHDFAAQHYDLAPSELTNSFKMRFQFAGGTGGGTVNIDDISVTMVSGNAPVTLAMTSGGSGNYSATIPGQATGTTLSYSVLATDSTSGIDFYASSYSVIAGSPVLAVTPSTSFASSGTVGSGSYTPSSKVYTLSNSGTGTLSWTASKTQTWLNLSATSGTLAAGASTNVTASINSANANALAVGSFSDSISFANTSNSSGNTTRSASLIIGSNTIPSTPTIAALPAYSQGTSRSLRWPAVAGATSYTLQISTTSNFASVLSSQTVATPSGSFANLTHGTTYYYRVLATNGIGSSSYSAVVSSIQDNVSPTVAITSPASAQTTATNSITLSGTSSDALSGISKVTVNGATASSSNGFATWSISVPLGFGTNSLTALAIDNAGNTTSTTPLLVTLTTAQSFNPLVIPDIITGTTFNLALKPQTKQFLAGAASTTNAYNDMLYGAPTLIMNKGDWVQMHVTNNLAVDTTTTHWHGFHIPAIMDGGPHQTIPAGTTWSPSWLVMNNAATYWYHPHLHLKTQEQVSRGGVGMIIIRDPEEAALNLPRSYGIDDIPLALGSRRFTSNQIVTVNSAYGDTMLVNGVINPQVSLPKQYVRLRILNAEIERSLNLGFSDNRTFWVIASDGGLLDAPVATTRVLLGVGERYEILVDLSNDTLGGSINLMAYNSSASLGTPLVNSFPGSENGTTGQFGSLLNNIDFNILRINIDAPTANPVLTRPTSLTTNTLWTNADITNPTTRVLNITGGAPGVFFFNTDQLFSPTVFNQTINFNAVERWTITNTSGFSHSFHIHDIEFALVSRVSANGGNPASITGIAPYEVSWKDTLYVQRNSSVTFIAKFDHFASNTNPFMYHCHFANHEDEGLMGQFIVTNNATEQLAVASFTRYGNSNLISLDFKTTPGTTYTLQYSPDLSTWTDIGSVTSDGNMANFTETDAGRLSGAKGFYRVMLPTVP
jgi:bilirubin oxidase